MRTIMIALSGLILAQLAPAQTIDPKPPQIAPPGQETLPDQMPLEQGSSDQNFTNIAIVAFEDLPAEIKTQAEAVIAQTSAEDLLQLQRSIDASPQATSALSANGLNSSQVVAANIDGDGTLTLIIQTTT